MNFPVSPGACRMKQPELQILTDQQSKDALADQKKKTRGILSRQILRCENQAYAGTSGISENNYEIGFKPGYCDTQTGETIISRFADGRPCPVHTLDGLPIAWVAGRDSSGRVLTARKGIIAGFLLDGCFYTRAQAAEMLKH